MKGISFRAWVLTICMLVPYVCFAAASLEIRPVRIEVPAGQNNSSFTINNNSDKPVLFQLKAVKWSQKSGEEIYTDTRDIIINPPVINIAADSYQLFRVGVRAPLNPSKEHTYRIFATQVATPEAAEGGITIQTLVQFNIPVFFAPKEIEKDLTIELRSLKNNQLQLFVANNSNMHILISNINLAKEDAKTPLISEPTFVYLLPEQKKTWNFSWDKPKNMDDLILKLHTDWGEIVEAADVS